VKNNIAVGSMLIELLQITIRNSVKIETFIRYHRLQQIFLLISQFKKTLPCHIDIRFVCF